MFDAYERFFPPNWLLPGIKMFLPLWTAVALMVTINGQTPDPFTNCTAGQFMEGGEARITCIFHQDGRKDVDHVFVTRYHDLYSNIIDDDVMICMDLSHPAQCELSEGYAFDGVISNTLTLTIPSVGMQQAGPYDCQATPPHDGPIHPCTLTVVAEDKRTPLPLAIFVVLSPVLVIVSFLVWLGVMATKSSRTNRRRD